MLFVIVVVKSILILFYLSVSLCNELDTLHLENIKDPNAALFLSLVPLLNLAEPKEVLTIPSLGQLYNEKPMKAFILSALKTYWLIDYEKSQKENNISDRNRSLWWLFGLVMYGAIDSYTDSHLDKFSNKKIKSTKKE